MEPWGVNEESAGRTVESLSQAEASLSLRSESASRRWGAFVALLMASSLTLVVGGSFHGWQKSASLHLSGTPRRAGKSQLGKLADRLLKSGSMFGSSDTKSSDNLEPSRTTKMSGAPLSLPLFFEANRGQAESRVKFLARSSGYTLFITPNETIFAGARTTAPLGMLSQAGLSVSEPGPAMLRMKLLQSNPGPEINGAKELPGKVNYLIGNNPRDWHTGVPLYEEVRSREVYPGIDLVFHGDQQRMEYDFQVAPGADPGQIRFKVAGAEKIEVAENGDLVLRAGKNEFRMRKPVIYQQDGESRLLIDGGYSLQAGKLVAFRLGAYDKGRSLVIDPTIVFASFLGAAGVEVPSGEALDFTNPSAPKLFVAGSTTDVTTFTETNSLIGTSGGAGDYAFVAKIDPTTTGAASLDFLTFIGGSLVFAGDTAPCQSFATDMKVDVSGGAGQVEPVVIGLTNCRDFPVTSGGPSTGTDDVFITRLTPTGAAIDNSTLFGGNGSEGITIGGGASLFLNPEGTIVLSGQTSSTNLPATLNAYSISFNNGTPGGFDDCYVAKMDRSFNILYLTYLNVGGNTTSGSTATCGVGAIDAVGKIYVGGTIYSATAFNLINGGAGANGFQKTFVGTPGTTPNTFVAVLDPSQSGLNQMKYATYIAGGGGTAVHAGAVDLAHGLAVVVGDTISNSTTNAPDIPLLNAIQSVNNSPAGVGTGFITVMDTTKTGAASLLASSYYGGSTGAGSTSARSVAFDSVPGNPPTQRIVVGGQTTATNFPTMNPLQASLVGVQNAFVSVLSVPSSGSSFTMSLLFSTYLGGGVRVSGQSDSVRALVTDSNHQVYALGRTVSANFFGNTTPATTVNGFQTTCASCGGGTPADDLAIFVLSPQSGTNVPDLTVTKSHSGSFSQGQSGAQYSITVTNSGTGATVGTVSLADSLPSSLTATAMTGTGWACSIGTLVCTRSDALAGGASYPVIILTVNVASNAPPSVTNTVTVSGGSETNTANDMASDVTTINSSVGACTNNYIGLTNGSWGTAANWSAGAVPVSTDVVCIPSGITVLVNTALAAANQTISALNSLGTITFSTSQLTVTNNSVANAINVSGGTLAFNGQLTVSGAFTQTSGTFGGTGEVDLNGALSWSGGTICSALTGVNCVAGTIAQLNANGGITFPSGSNTVLSFRTLNSSGTATWSGTAGTLDMINGSTISNLPSGIWNFANDSRVAFGGGNTVAFNNAGMFEKTGGTGTSTVGAPFHNTGTALGNSGTLSFTGGGNCGSSCPGTFTAGAGATTGFGGGIFAQSGPINGTGTLNFNGAAMDFGTGVEVISTTTINITSGILGGAAPGVVNFETRPNWSGGTMCSSLTGASCATGNNGTTNMNAGINFPASSNVVLSFRTVNNNGTATWSGTGGTLDLVNAAVINNAATSMWNYTNDSVVAFGGGNTVAFNNAGTFEKTGGTGTSTFSAPFHNTGTVLGNSGTLSFSGGGNCGSTCSGTFTAGPGAAISFAGSVFGQSGPINGSGTVNFNGATMNFGTGTETISTTNVNFSAGVIAGAAPGILNFSTPLNWTGGTMCSSISGISCATGTNATTNANAGINFPASSNVVLSFRTLNNNGTATSSGAAGTLDMVNGAIINNPATSVWNYTNDSTLAFGGGTAVVFNNAGTFEKTGGVATTTIGLNFNNTGTVLGNSGTLSFTGGGNCGSTCSGMFTAGPGAAISFAGNVFGQSGAINGAGTVNFAGATMDFGTGTETISTSTINFTGGILAGASPGILNFSTPLNWSGGTMCSTLSGGSCIGGTNATTNANAGINFPTSANVALFFRTLNNNGTATWSGAVGSLDMANGAVVNNPANSVWNYTNDSTLGFGGGTAVAFNNGGTFEKTGGAATTTIGLNFSNTGTVLGNSGTLSFTGGGNCGSTCSGTFSAGTGAAISFGANVFGQSGPINGAGTVNFNGATVDFGTGTETISTATINFTSGTLGGAAPGILNFSTPLNWTGGTMCSSISGISCAAGTNATTNANAGIKFPASANVALFFRTLNNNGAATWSGAVGSLDMANGAVVNNGVAAVWNYTNDSSLAFGGGAAVTFNNAGTFEKTGGTATTTIGMPFNSSGTVLANAANLSFGNTFTQTAGTTTLGGGSIQTSSVHPLTFQGGSFTGTGTVQGDVTNTGGSVAPGSATTAGAISLSGSGLGVYAQSATGAYNVKIGGTSAGQFDTLTMSGAATLGGPLNVSLINSFSPALGNTFTVLTAASVTGTFSTTNLPALSTGLGWRVTYNATSVVLSVVTVTAAALQSITVTPTTPVVTPGNTVQYTATGHFSDGTTGATSVSWTSSDTTIATVNAAGLATSIKTGGPITITATSTTNAAISGTATLVVASPIGFVLTGSLNSARTLPTATVLNNGRVLVAGGAGVGPASTLSSAELYDQATGTFAFTGSLNVARYGHTATLLADGRVLIAGGATNGAGTELASAEVYDPKTGSFTALGNMTTARFGHAATWLPNGTVLITGGVDSTNASLSSAEIFDPATGKFTSAGNMAIPRVGHTATLGIDNIVIIAGGGGTAATLNSVEIYDTAAPAFAATSGMIAGRSNQTASVLQDNLLVAGGFDTKSNSLSSAEIRNDDLSTFTAAGSMTTSRVFDTATILNNGTVLFAGGYIYSLNKTFLVLPSAELYDPIANTFAATGSLNFGRDDHAAVRLNNGKALVLGGDNVQFDGVTSSGTELASAELFTPTTFTQPGLTAISAIPVNPTIPLGTFQRFTASGTGATLISASVTWNSSNPAVISITNDATNSGTGYAVGPGTATITGCEGTVCGSTTVTVPSAVRLQSIALAPANPSIAKGLTQQFTATGNYSDGSHQNITGQATWASATPGVATINAAGLATGVGVGTSNVTASLSGVTSPIDVLTVTPAILQNIAVTPANPSIAKGLTQQFAATGMHSDGSLVDLTSQVTWNSATRGVATISATGLATGVGVGTSNITASLLGVTSPIDVLTITAPAVQSIGVLPLSTTVSANGIQQFLALGTFTDGSNQDLGANVTWKSSDTTIATINSSGAATGILAGGPVTITATSTANPAVSGTAQLSVSAHAPYAYVDDKVSANCCLDVFDTSTHQLVAAIPMTNFTFPLGVTPDQSRVYMADYLNNLVDVVDTTTNTLMTTIPIGNGPNAVAITPDGKFGYVADFNDNNVPVFNVATNTAVASVPVGFPTGWVSITPDGAWVYAASFIDGRVAVINTATNTLSSTITLTAPAGQPAVGCVNGPTFNPTGTLGYFLLACSGNTFTGNTVDVLSIPSNTLVTTITVGSGPLQAVVTPDGSRLVVTNTSSNNVSVIDTATNTVSSTIPLGGQPVGIAVTPDGTRALVTQRNPATVDVIKFAANTVTSNIATTRPSGIVIASPPAASAATILSLTPSNLIFNAQVVGTQSVTQAISLKNPGATPVTLTSISLTGPNPGDFRLINGCPNPPATLGAGASCNLQISSDPTANGQRTALVTINSTNGIAASTESAPLSGTGISLVSIAVTPASTSVIATNKVQFTATGTFSDNSTQDLTSSVIWTSSSTGIATINASGLATGVAAGGPITITATSGNISGTAQLTVTPLVVTFPLNVTLIGTGNGSVTDNLGSINCVDTAGVISGKCSASYPAGTIVTLTATPTAPSTFGGWLQACSGTAGCSVTMNSAQSVTASFVPPPKAIPVPLTPGTNVSGMATYNCPSNPNPSPGNPCLDPNAHAAAFTIGQVLTPFTLTVVATEVPPTNGDGICSNGLTPTQDFDCRFKSFFTFQTKANGDTVVPLCDPYANGNCVVYSVFFQKPGQEPDPSMYVGPVNWNITFNNDTFVPPAPYTGSTPRLYYDPSGFVVPNSPYGTDCTTPMLIGNPGVPTNPAIFCQFVFDITTVFDPTKKVDFLIGGKSKVFSDTVVAFPPVFAPVVTVTTTPDAATVTAGSPIGFTIAVSNSAAAAANSVTLNTPLPGGTNVNWTISPAYTGPGTCSITGAQGSQVLNCAFGTLSPSTNLSVHILSASSAAGTAISPSTVVVGSQQLLSIGSIVVQPIPVTFSGLTASQSIPAGTSSIALSGVVGNGTQFAPSGETVSITINGNKQTATIGSKGAFSLQFPTAAIPGSTTPYPITYSYAGDSLLSSATSSSTTLTVVSPPAGVNLTATLKSATIDGSGNYVFTIRVTNNGSTTAAATTIKTAVLTTAIGTTRVTTASTTPLPVTLGSIAYLSSVTTTLTFPASAGPPNTAGIISLGFGFTGGSASSVLRATLP